MAAVGQTCTVVELGRVREARSGERLLAEVERDLEDVRVRLTALCTGGALFSRSGGRDGRRLLLAQDALLEARRLLLEVTGTGALPAPRREATRERLLLWAREHRSQARERLGHAPASVPVPLR